MEPQEFINSYQEEKLQLLCSAKIINNIEGEGDKYYVVWLTPKSFDLNFDFEEWSRDQFLYQINEVGMMFAEAFVHKGKKEDFISLDEFMYYTRILEQPTTNISSLISYPFKKEEGLSKKDFMYYNDLYWNEHFMVGRGNLININYYSYLQGFFYFNEPSVIYLGCELENEFWAFNWNPYI